MYVGQTIAIPVLDRHITHSAGICASGGGGSSIRTRDCVMSDAVRDRFKGARDVSVGGDMTDFSIDGRSVTLTHAPDMAAVIGLFDQEVDDLLYRQGVVSVGGEDFDFDAAIKEVYRSVRAQTPRVVHAVVSYLDEV